MAQKPSIDDNDDIIRNYLLTVFPWLLSDDDYISFEQTGANDADYIIFTAYHGGKSIDIAYTPDQEIMWHNSHKWVPVTQTVELDMFKTLFGCSPIPGAKFMLKLRDAEKGSED